MIATDHQYRVTNDRLAKFRAALEAAKAGKGVSEAFHAIQTRAIAEQIAALESELKEYDELRSGRVGEIAVDGLGDLPKALVKARIARGLSQSALAELLNVKPQQVQRWEADGYSRVGFDRLKRIARELRIRIPQRLELEGEPPVAPSEIRRTMMSAGLPREVFDRAILPSRRADDDIVLSDEIDARVRVLFGERAAAFRGKFEFERVAMHFKLPASADQARTRAYAAYVSGLCGIVAKCLPHQTRALPIAWDEMRALVLPNGSPSLCAALNACWGLGIAVIALNDPIAFHGACWRQQGRTVVVLKQTFPDEFRWLFDLIHELFHAAAAPEGDFTLLEAEETSPERRLSVEERRANRFAAEVLTNGRLRELTDEVVRRAQSSAPLLKSATVEVAEESDLPPGLLANLVAQRLADEPSNQSWWATAASFHAKGDSPWKIVRDAFLEHAEISALDRIERDIVLQLMETTDA